MLQEGPQQPLFSLAEEIWRTLILSLIQTGDLNQTVIEG